MNKSSAIVFTAILAVACVILAAVVLRVEMLKTQNAFLMEFVRLESAPLSEYEKSFGQATHTARQSDLLSPDLMAPIDGKLTEGQTAFFFSAQTIPTRYLVIVSDESGNIVWRTWIPM